MRTLPVNTCPPWRAFAVLCVLACLPLGWRHVAGQEQPTGVVIEVVPIAAAPRRAVLLGVEPPWTFLLQVEGEEDALRLPADALFTLAKPRSESQSFGPFSQIVGPHVLLANGDLLRGQVGEATDEAISMRSRLLGELSLPWEAVSMLALRGGEGPGKQQRPRSGGQNQDVLHLANGDSVGGTILAISKQQIELDSTVGNVQVARSGIASVSFNPDLTYLPTPEKLHALVWLSDGSRLTATALDWNGTQLVLETPYGVRVEIDPSAVEQMQFLGGRLVYLSDMEPQEYEHTPYLSVRWPYQRDRSVGGNPIQLGGRTYAKGLGMHSASRLRYALDGRYQRFEATVGIDDETEGDGSVVFRVLVDGRERLATPVVRGADGPITLEPLDLTGAQTLELLVEHADYGDVQDHADWADARLVRAIGGK